MVQAFCAGTLAMLDELFWWAYTMTGFGPREVIACVIGYVTVIALATLVADILVSFAWPQSSAARRLDWVTQRVLMGLIVLGLGCVLIALVGLLL